MLGTPKAVRVRKYTEPAKLDTNNKPTNWLVAKEAAQQSVGSYGGPGRRKGTKNQDLISLIYDTWAADSTKASSVWSMAAEKSMAINDRHVRGQYQIVKMSPLVPKKAMDSWSNGMSERFWDQTTGMLIELKLLVDRKRGADHVADICSRLVNNLDQYKDMMPNYTPDVLDLLLGLRTTPRACIVGTHS